MSRRTVIDRWEDKVREAERILEATKTQLEDAKRQYKETMPWIEKVRAMDPEERQHLFEAITIVFGERADEDTKADL